MKARQVAALVAAAVAVAAAGDVSFLGRFESRLSFAQYRAGSVLSGDNRIRMALDARPGPGFVVDAAVLARAVHGARELDLVLLLPEVKAESLSDSLRASLRVTVTGGLELDRASATLGWSRFRLRVGKQPMAWGVGYLWNPTEVLPSKSWLDPTYERGGVSALRLEWLGAVGVQVFGLPGPDLAGSAAIGRVSGNVSGFDWALTGWRRPGEAVPTDLFFGGQLKGEILLPGIWCEGGFHPGRDVRPSWWEFVAGTDITLATRTWLAVEYRHNSAGYAGHSGYPVAAWLEQLLGVRNGLGRDQLYASVRHPLAGFSSMVLAGLANLGDRSAVLLPGLQLGVADNVDLYVQAMWSVGSGVSEYGAAGVRGAVCRLALHF
ncbi:MAG: hypothetical protein R6X14_04845 [bacterium]